MTDHRLVVVGSSWGGMKALRQLLPGLPADLNAAVVIAQHRGADSTHGGLGQLLADCAQMPLHEATDKLPIEPGNIYLAPPDYHLLVEGDFFALSLDERVQYARPSIDVLFESAADACGDRVVALVLTGANEDGADGVRRVKDAGGRVLVQDPETADRSAMPAAAIATGAADEVLHLDDVARRIVALCGQRESQDR